MLRGHRFATAGKRFRVPSHRKTGIRDVCIEMIAGKLCVTKLLTSYCNCNRHISLLWKCKRVLVYKRMGL